MSELNDTIAAIESNTSESGVFVANMTFGNRSDSPPSSCGKAGSVIEENGRRFLEVAVLLTKSELIYDIEFVTNRIAKVNAVDAEGNASRLAGDITAEGGENLDYLYRLIMSACKKLRSSTSWASGVRGRMVVSDMIPSDISDWTFVFHVPEHWRGEVDVLASLCHDYVKNRVASDWLKMVAPRMSDNFEFAAEEALRDVRYELRKECSVNPPRLYNLTEV